MSDCIDIKKIMGKLICFSVTIHKWREKMDIFTLFYAFFDFKLQYLRTYSSYEDKSCSIFQNRS